MIEASGQGIDIVRAGVSYTLGVGQAIEGLTTANSSGTDAISLTGNNLYQSVVGNAGSNVLNGAGGNDNLIGLAGADAFVFDTALGAGNVDHIVDFSTVADTMQLARGIFSALARGELSASAFKDIGVPGAKVDADDRIVYDHNTGSLTFAADGSGSKAAVQFATLDNHAALTFHDFRVV